MLTDRLFFQVENKVQTWITTLAKYSENLNQRSLLDQLRNLIDVMKSLIAQNVTSEVYVSANSYTGSTLIAVLSKYLL